MRAFQCLEDHVWHHVDSCVNCLERRLGAAIVPVSAVCAVVMLALTLCYQYYAGDDLVARPDISEMSATEDSLRADSIRAQKRRAHPHASSFGKVLVLQGVNFATFPPFENFSAYTDHPKGFRETDYFNETPSVWGWVKSAVWNYWYARSKGYDYALYRYGDSWDYPCFHESRGLQEAQWCKVLAVLNAFEHFPQHDTFLWLDTDCFFRNISLSLDEFFARAVVTSTLNKCGGHVKARDTLASTSIYAWRNLPKWGCGAMTGIFIVRRGPSSMQILRDWWDHAGWPWPACGPYDQGYFCKSICDSQFGKEIQLIDEECSEDNPAQFIHHRCGACEFLPHFFDTVVRIQDQKGGPPSSVLWNIVKSFMHGSHMRNISNLSSLHLWNSSV